jgi:hypothetical protein
VESHESHQDAPNDVANQHHSVYSLADTFKVTRFTFFPLLQFSVRRCLPNTIFLCVCFFLLVLLLLWSYLHHATLRHKKNSFQFMQTQEGNAQEGKAADLDSVFTRVQLEILLISRH